MANIDIKIIHPTNNSDIDIRVPDETLLGDVFAQLIEAGFLTNGQKYSGMCLDRPYVNEMSLSENGIKDYTTIVTLISAKTGDGVFDYFITKNPELGWLSILSIRYQLLSDLLAMGRTHSELASIVREQVVFDLMFIAKNDFIKSTQINNTDSMYNADNSDVTTEVVAHFFDITFDDLKILLDGLKYVWHDKISTWSKTDATDALISTIQEILTIF